MSAITRSLFVFNSEYTYKKCQQLYGHVLKGTVIYSMVQFDGLSIRSRSNASSRYFLIIGGSRQRKKPEIIVNVWSKSELKNIFELVIIGSIPSQLLSEESHQQMTLGKVKFMDGIDGYELKSLVENCVATIFYSLGEGWGQPLAESVFCGKPVICNDLEVFHEVANGFAEYFPSNSPFDLVPIAIRINRMNFDGLIDEKEIIEFGNRYSLEKLKKDWTKLLD